MSRADYEGLGGDREDILHTLFQDWRVEVARVFNTGLEHTQTCLALHEIGANMPFISLDVMCTVGTDGLVTVDTLDRITMEVEEGLILSMLRSPLIPFGSKIAVWTLPQHEARYESIAKWAEDG